MTTKKWDLGHGVIVGMHAPSGFDEMAAWSIGLGVKAEDDPRVIAMGATGYLLAKERFQSAMAICDSVEGIDFTPVVAQDDEPTRTKAFLEFTALPRSIYRKWTDAVRDMLEVMNESDLLPKGKVTDDQLTDPLSSGDGDDSIKT